MANFKAEINMFTVSYQNIRHSWNYLLKFICLHFFKGEGFQYYASASIA